LSIDNEEPTKNDMTKYKDNRWYILFVKSDGRTVPIRHIKGIIWAVVSFMTALLVCAGVMVFFYADLVAKKTELERIVTTRDQEKAAIQKEKDSLMAQLAIAESKLKISMMETIESDAVASTDHAETPKEMVAPDKEKVAKVSEKKTPPEHEIDRSSQTIDQEPATVSVDNLLVCFDPDAGRMYVEFKVINIGEKKQPVSGYTYTILKDGKEETDGWLIFPKTQLYNGIPTQTRGMRFRIYNFRTMKFSVQYDEPNPYTYATVFVYQQGSDKLMLERDFEINTISVCP
jgi:hypothetical protein